MPTAALGGHRWDFFVAHASPDASVAEQLAARLETGGARVFLDVHKVLPGDVWSQVLADAQDASAVTVVLVSDHTAGAYYQLEELATAIDKARHAPGGHRVAPVYLEPVERVPYGLRILHGLWALDPVGLEDAARQLLRLLPGPGEAPPARLWGGQVPAVTEFFAGRDELLGRLAGHSARRVSVLTQSVAGLGGVGKTTLAAAFCWEQAQVLDIVWWLRAQTETALIADLAELAAALGATAGGEDLGVAARAACRALEREQRRWLVVFDNAEDDELVRHYTPRRGDGRVVVTTRRRDFRRLGPVVDVDVFDPVTAEKFLRARVKDTNLDAAAETHAADVARRLGGLPLALEQAGAYVAYSPRRSFAAYLKVLDDYGLDPFVVGQPLEYHATATTTWQVSIAAAARRAPVAPKIMAAFAYLAPASVPIALFVELADHPYLAATTAEVTAAIDELYAYSLIAIDHTTISVHRVIRDAARRQSNPGAGGFVVDALRLIHPNDVERPGTWSACAQLLLHVQLLSAIPTATNPATASKISWLLNRASMALRYAGAAVQAIPLLEQAANLDVDLHGTDHLDTLMSRNNLAAAYCDAGRTDDAIILHETCLADMQRVLGPDHRYTLQSRGTLASAYRAAGRTDEAITLHEMNLAATEGVFGPDHPDTLTCYDNLALAYSDGGRTDEAITMHETDLAVAERVFESDHPHILYSRAHLAAAYRDAGRTDEAVTMHETNLAAQKRVFGLDHPQTLFGRGNLANAYWAAGRTEEAVTLHETNLADTERIFGTNHRYTLQCRGNLAVAYCDAGRTDEAVTLHETNLSDYEMVLGPDHFDTIQCRRNLAVAYWAAGRTDKAVTLHETNLADTERIFGPNHRYTLQSRRNLAVAYSAAGRANDAIALWV